MKAATVGNYKVRNKPLISIHAAREGGDDSLHLLGNDIPISIHAAREGGDATKKAQTRSLKIFQSTPPVKAATVDIGNCPVIRRISIHAAREGGDRITLKKRICNMYFNPRRP